MKGIERSSNGCEICPPKHEEVDELLASVTFTSRKGKRITVCTDCLHEAIGVACGAFQTVEVEQSSNSA